MKAEEWNELNPTNPDEKPPYLTREDILKTIDIPKAWIPSQREKQWDELSPICRKLIQENPVWRDYVKTMMSGSNQEIYERIVRTGTEKDRVWMAKRVGSRDKDLVAELIEDESPIVRKELALNERLGRGVLERLEDDEERIVRDAVEEIKKKKEREAKKSLLMKRFERKTGRNAIWRGKVTKQFKEWVVKREKKKEEIYEKNVTKRIRKVAREIPKRSEYESVSSLRRITLNESFFRKNETFIREVLEGNDDINLRRIFKNIYEGDEADKKWAREKVRKALWREYFRRIQETTNLIRVF